MKHEKEFWEFYKRWDTSKLIKMNSAFHAPVQNAPEENKWP